MSAYVVPRAHIDYLLTAADHYARASDPFNWWTGTERAYLRPEDPQGVNEVGRMLYGENVRSVRYRYPDTVGNDTKLPGVCAEVEEASDPQYTFRILPGVRIVPGEVGKALACYEYQTCETDDHRDTEAWRFCEALRDAILRTLPGYEGGPWEVDEEWLATRTGRAQTPSA
jgi:hypothetical protein